MTLSIHSFPTGPVQANCHILHDVERDEFLIVDPGDDAPDIIAFARRLGGRCVAIWNTHSHFDHVSANADVQAAMKAPISIHAIEAANLGSTMLSRAALFGLPFTPSKADVLWQDGDVIQALGRGWKVHLAPGHSPGSVVLACAEEKLALAGDVLFRDSVGRTDLPGGSAPVLRDTLRLLLGEWTADDWRVLVGHGAETTIGRERARNPFVADALGSGARFFDGGGDA
jgi:glyoxylase-like metal-dependent hydrolase (beta-lactamase superfamily II)